MLGGLLVFCAVWGSVLAAQPTRRPTDLERGKTLYERHCVLCHGDDAEGDGPAAAALTQPVPSLLGQVEPNEETVRLVLRGSGAMPGYMATMDTYDARRVLRYIKQLSSSPAERAERAREKAAPAEGEPPAEEGPDPQDASPEEEEADDAPVE